MFIQYSSMSVFFFFLSLSIRDISKLYASLQVFNGLLQLRIATAWLRSFLFEFSYEAKITGFQCFWNNWENLLQKKKIFRNYNDELPLLLAVTLNHQSFPCWSFRHRFLFNEMMMKYQTKSKEGIIVWYHVLELQN